MSSIYRKGRDRYYYYQAYLFNPETKKKKKKIFHALNTKDKIKAEIKQKELDEKYKKQKTASLNQPKMKSFGNLSKQIIIISFTSLATILAVKTFSLSTENNIKKDTSGDYKRTLNKYKIKTRNLKSETFEDTIYKNLKTENKSKIEVFTGASELNKKSSIKYTVQRVDALSEAFQLCKVYITINKNSSRWSQLNLCKDITSKYSQFSNIIICLYENNQIGKKLAMGFDEEVSIEQKKQFWLGMYTYNSVEGEFFDDNPSGYLGHYKKNNI